MDTRQLRAFCAVVERESFSRAASNLGVTQPAVSQQVRSLEKRIGVQLLDRSGRRVVPTDAGTRLYRSAQRLLALEEQLLADLAGPLFGPLTGAFELGASTGPAAIVVPLLVCEFKERHPSLDIRLSVHDTQTVVSLVAERELELGIVGAARRRRSVEFEPFFSDDVILACPPGHPAAGKTISFDELMELPLVLMQEGAGVRQLLEDELRRRGKRLRDLRVDVVLGLQESVKSAVQAGYAATFISRRAVDSDLAAGTLAEIRVAGLDLQREVSIARAAGRVPSRAAEAFVDFAREKLST
jgi:DNA-binding transcriptional LysR family regulator